MILGDWRYLPGNVTLPEPVYCVVCSEQIYGNYFYDREANTDVRGRVHERCAAGNLPDETIAKYIARKMGVGP